MKKKLLLTLALIISASVAFGQDDSRFKIGSNDVFKGPVGLQLYSLRDTFGQSVEKGFDVAEELGFGYVELAGKYNLSNEEMLAKLKEHHLTPIAGHWDYNLFKTSKTLKKPQKRSIVPEKFLPTMVWAFIIIIMGTNFYLLATIRQCLTCL